jgi:hypothetical protein
MKLAYFLMVMGLLGWGALGANCPNFTTKDTCEINMTAKAIYSCGKVKIEVTVDGETTKEVIFEISHSANFSYKTLTSKFFNKKGNIYTLSIDTILTLIVNQIFVKGKFKGCENFSAPINVLINNPNQPLGFDCTAIKTIGTSTKTGEITGKISGGTSPYTVQLFRKDDPATSPKSLVQLNQGEFKFDTLQKGVYRIVVTDACPESPSIKECPNVEVKNCVLKFTDVKGTYTCSPDKGKIEWSLNGLNSKPQFYINGSSLTNILANNRGVYTYTNQEPGTYILKAIADNCSVDTTIILTVPNAPTIKSSKIDSIKCSNEKIGKITITVEGVAPPYKYEWSNGATTDSIINLSAGTYKVIVTDKAGCKVEKEFKVEQSLKPVLSGEATNVKCNGQANGKIELKVNPTDGDYQYFRLKDGKPEIFDKELTGLSKDEFTFIVVDRKTKCRDTSDIIEILEPLVLNVTLTPTQPQCQGEKGTIKASVSGGNTPYTYLWSGGTTTSTITNLLAGAYTLTVTDANKCAATKSVTLSDPSSPQIAVNPVIKDIECSNDPIGSISIAVNGGTGTLKYQWSKVGDSNFKPTIKNLTQISRGNYTVTVTDASGCTDTKSFIIGQTFPPVLKLDTMDVSCKGEANGAIKFTTDSTYTYTWSTIGTSEKKVLENLKADNYSVTVTTKNNCTEIRRFNIREPDKALKIDTIVIVTPSLCRGSLDGEIKGMASGGWGTFKYQWLDVSNKAISGANKANLDVSTGKYSLMVTDAKNCVVTKAIDFDVAKKSVFYNFIPEPNQMYKPLTGTNSTSKVGNAWDDPLIEFELGEDSKFKLFKDVTVKKLWLLDEFSGVVLSTKKIERGNLPKDSASLIVVYGSDLADRAFKPWLKSQSTASSPIKFSTVGRVGERVWTIEWSNAGFFNELNETGKTPSFVNFQISLDEKTKNIDINFGPSNLINPDLVHNGYSGPLIALVKDYTFSTDTYRDIWYLTGNPSQPIYTSGGAGKLQALKGSLNAHPVAAQKYKFCYVESIGFRPDSSDIEPEIFITPNPTTDQTLIQFTPLPRRAKLWVSDQLGRQVLPMLDLAAGATQAVFNLQTLPRGLYFIHLHDAKSNQVQKVIKQ